MKKIDNKGQSLVLFVLMLPLMLGIMALVIDCGLVLTSKNNVDNVIEIVLDYGLDLIKKEEQVEENTYIDDDVKMKPKDIEVLLDYNLKDCDNQVEFIDEEIRISVDTYVHGVFARIFGFKGFLIKSEYVGNVTDGQKEIKKIK